MHPTPITIKLRSGIRVHCSGAIGEESISGIVESFFLIFTGAALLATLALYSRQPLLVAYIAIGCVLGPHGLQLVADPDVLTEIAEIGIIFLLFLVGLDLQPAKLRNMLGEGLLTALGSTLAFFALGFGLMLAFGFNTREALVTGIAVTFSSTIIGIKLLPTTVLHHRHIGEIVVSLLLIQDLVAILALILLTGFSGDLTDTLTSLGWALAGLPVVTAAAFVGVRFAVLPLIAKFDAFHEFIFLLALGWCLGIASLAVLCGLSLEIGAFVAGVALATSPISQYIAESLRPLRDFFLVLFFFSVGAALNPELLLEMLLPTVLLALALVVAKPVVFALLLRAQGETPETAWESGYRLGQASEFSLLVSYVAAGSLLGAEAAHVLQGATVLTMILSTYAVIFRYPSPIAVSARLRRD
ncbi:MAG: cation:proton antiporter [Pseudomonadales bacterium]